jgi:hypothetical protein
MINNLLADDTVREIMQWSHKHFWHIVSCIINFMKLCYFKGFSLTVCYTISVWSLSHTKIQFPKLVSITFTEPSLTSITNLERKIAMFLVL